MNSSELQIFELGRLDSAQRVFERFYEGSKAYRDLIDRASLRGAEWKNLPLLT